MFITWKPIIFLPVSVLDVWNFSNHLFLVNYLPSSIASHISAISYVHKMLNMQDSTQAFIAKKIKKGCKSSVTTKDTRLPITPHILPKLLHALAHTVPQYLLRILLCALFLLAFHAFSRLGEVAAKTLNNSKKDLQRSDFTFQYTGSKLSAV